MSGGMLTWFTSALVVLAVVLMLAIAVVLLPRMVRTLTTSFFCLWVRRRVTVQFLTCDGRHPVGVLSCTAFADPRVVGCGRLCVGGEDSTALAGGERKAGDTLSG